MVPEKISRVIVVPTGKLGDVVCCTPVLRALRSQLPKVHLIVAGNSKLHKALLADSGLVDEYIDLEGDNSIGLIKKSSADVALVTGPSYTSTALLFASGIPLVVSASVVGGFSPSETRPYKILKKFVKTFPYHIEAYAPRERLKVLEPFGIFSDDTKKTLGFSKKASERVEKFLTDKKINPETDFLVGISPTAGNKIKEWPRDRFAEVADYLIGTRKLKVVILGGRGDEEAINTVVRNMRFSEQVLKVTDFNIDELKALVSKLYFFVSVDTGPIYIAEAFGVPTIDIVGPVDENVQPPRGLIHRNVVPPNRGRPELSILNSRFYDENEAIQQVLSISVEAVIKEIEKLINDLKI